MNVVTCPKCNTPFSQAFNLANRFTCLYCGNTWKGQLVSAEPLRHCDVAPIHECNPFVDLVRNSVNIRIVNGFWNVAILPLTDAPNGYGYRAFADNGGGALPKFRDNYLSWDASTWDEVKYLPLDVCWKNDLFRPAFINSLVEFDTLSFANWHGIPMLEIMELCRKIQQKKEPS